MSCSGGEVIDREIVKSPSREVVRSHEAGHPRFHDFTISRFHELYSAFVTKQSIC